MAAFLRQIKIRVLTLTSRKSNEKIKIYGASDYQGAPEPARRQESGGDLSEIRYLRTNGEAQPLFEIGLRFFYAAAGNSYDDANFYSPARATHANIYTISAVAQGDFWAYFSNYGTVVDYAAPGYNVKSTWINGGYNTISGTSMASPHAAGILLLGSPKTGGYVKDAYWEYTKKGGGTLTGKYGATNSYSQAIFRGDLDGKIDPVMVR